MKLQYHEFLPFARQGVPQLKWYFALSDASVPGNGYLPADRSYVDMLMVAVISAQLNTSLKPHLLYDGAPCPLTDELEEMGVKVLFHKLSFIEAIQNYRPDQKLWQRIARGDYLRVDVPLLELTDEFILYTDVDVMFLKDIEAPQPRPSYFAAAAEFDQRNLREFNTGVMILNVPAMRESHSEFVEFITRDVNRPAFDQTAFQLFYAGKASPLDSVFNWKPYWGDCSDATVVHFHGPKPFHVDAIRCGKSSGIADIVTSLYSRAPDAYERAVERYRYYLSRRGVAAPAP